MAPILQSKILLSPVNTISMADESRVTGPNSWFKLPIWSKLNVILAPVINISVATTPLTIVPPNLLPYPI